VSNKEEGGYFVYESVIKQPK